MIGSKSYVKVARAKATGFRAIKKPIAPLLAAFIGLSLAAAGGAMPVSASTAAPFNLFGTNWCPTYHGDSGCDNVQSPTSPAYNVPFDPAQVSISGKNGYVNLTMQNSTGSATTGAINTQTQETYNYGTTFTAKLNLPCNSNGAQIAGWPAFWTDGSASGSNYAPGEIDIAEGLHGQVHYGIHYQASNGKEGTLGGTYPGNPLCGVNTYQAVWNGNSGGHVAFYLNGTWIASFSSSDMGVPMFTDPQQVNIDYGSGAAGGPDVFPSTMQVESFSATN